MRPGEPPPHPHSGVCLRHHAGGVPSLIFEPILPLRLADIARMLYERMFETLFVVPDDVLQLLSIEKKAALVKYCRGLTITKSALAALVFRASDLGYSYDRKTFEYVPGFLQRGADPPSTMANEDGSITKEGQKFANRIVSIFDQRRVFIAHLFYNADKWHIFYLDYDDIEDHGDNHWKGGPHVHFVNRLWANLTRETAWAHAWRQVKQESRRAHRVRRRTTP